LVLVVGLAFLFAGAWLLLFPKHERAASLPGCSAFFNSSGVRVAACAACPAPWLRAWEGGQVLCRCMAPCSDERPYPAEAPGPRAWTAAHDAEAVSARGVQLVIGLGTGRCGTTTFSHLLRSQRGTRALFSHELHPVLPWAAGGNASRAAELASERVSTLLRRVEGRAAAPGAPPLLVGDVASFYLPFVRALLAAEPGARFVVLQRPRRAVVASFLAKDPGVDLWSACAPRDGWSDNHAYWATAHPKLACGVGPGGEPRADARAALGAYWDLYAAEAGALAAAFPDRVRVVDSPRIFRQKAALTELLTWLGFEQPNVEGRMGRYNKGRARGGESVELGRAAGGRWRRSWRGWPRRRGRTRELRTARSRTDEAPADPAPGLWAPAAPLPASVFLLRRWRLRSHRA